ncbi:uncharacterized protein natalisin [Chelonus insularis]|uniref:uncharacterized protein natalisin n=1 Tax=Chelonus insularis TaxID=460826 RepID=UPI00158B74F9|nr:uncharacterized protein LOC118074046 [Chelonus insularis]
MAPTYESPETVDKVVPIESILKEQIDPIIDQCLLIPDSQNNQIFVLSTTNGKELISQNRRIVRSWMPDAPLYAEEPKWIVIENMDKFSKNQKKHGISTIEEPFYIARGKRLLKNRSPVHYPMLENVLIEDDLSLLKGPNKKTNSLIKLNYLEPGEKNANILSLLHEPFFISRGKKNMSEHLKNTKHKFSDYDDSSLRDRRGEDFLEQLFKENDPFYITRGKKSEP